MNLASFRGFSFVRLVEKNSVELYNTQTSKYVYFFLYSKSGMGSLSPNMFFMRRISDLASLLFGSSLSAAS